MKQFTKLCDDEIYRSTDRQALRLLRKELIEYPFLLLYAINFICIILCICQLILTKDIRFGFVILILVIVEFLILKKFIPALYANNNSDDI